jgi:hypothetical protein
MHSSQTISSYEPTPFLTSIFLFDLVRISELTRRKREPTALKLPPMSYAYLPHTPNSTNNKNTSANISNTNAPKPTSIPTTIFPAGHPYKPNSTPSLLFTQCGSNWRPPMQAQALGVIGRGSVNSNVSRSFDHILARLQGELLKIWETGAELHHLTGAMTDMSSVGCWYGFVFICIISFMG